MFVVCFLENQLGLKLMVVCVCGSQPCYLKDWEMHVQFKVHGSGKKNLHGDGIAIWYTRDRLQAGSITTVVSVFH